MPVHDITPSSEGVMSLVREYPYGTMLIAAMPIQSEATAQLKMPMKPQNFLLAISLVMRINPETAAKYSPLMRNDEAIA
jgi:hypothetical protein